MIPHATGPRTDAGKKQSSLNSVQHGLCSEQPVLPCEDPAEWQQFHDGVLAELEPVGILEKEYAERVALHHWRLRRVTRFEAVVGMDQYQEATHTAAGRLLGRDPADADWKALIQAHRDSESATEALREHDEALKLVEALPTMPASAEATPESVLYLLGLLGETNVAEMSEPATAALLRSELPRTAGKTLPETLTFLRTELAEEHAEAEAALADSRQRFDRLTDVMAMQTEREGHAHRLLTAPELDRLVRYEAHVSRQLRQAQEALDKLQAKRRARQAERAEPVRSVEKEPEPAQAPAVVSEVSVPPEKQPSAPTVDARSFRSFAEGPTAQRTHSWPNGRATPVADPARAFVPQISPPNHGVPVEADARVSEGKIFTTESQRG